MGYPCGVTAAQLERFNATSPDLVDHFHQMRQAMAEQAENWACNRRDHTSSRSVLFRGRMLLITVPLFTEGLN